MSRRKNNSNLLIWRWPIALGVISAAGLVTALLGDGWYDLISCAALGGVAATGIWLGTFRKAKQATTAQQPDGR